MIILNSETTEQIGIDKAEYTNVTASLGDVTWQNDASDGEVVKVTITTVVQDIKNQIGNVLNLQTEDFILSWLQGISQ